MSSVVVEDLLSVVPTVDGLSHRASCYPLSAAARSQERRYYDSELEEDSEVDEDSVLITKVKNSLYKFTRKLDQGGFSEIFLGKVGKTFGFTRSYEREFVIKCCEVQETDGDGKDEQQGSNHRRQRPRLSRYRQIEREIMLFRRAQGKHVVSLVEAFKLHQNEINEVYIVMEKLETGLHRLVKGPDDALEALQVGAIVGDVLLGLKHIHAKGIVHRDIKCSNILLSKTGCAKICDFGLAGLLGKQNQLNSDNYLYGTHGFMAPEMLISNMPYDYTLDVWSLGITVLFLLRGKMPYNSEEVNVHKDFSYAEWTEYKKSQEQYYVHLIGRDVLDYASSNRRRKHLFEDTSLSAEERDGILKSSCENRDVLNFLKLSLIPSPAQGWKNDRVDFTVTRKVRERASVQELLETKLIRSDGISKELAKRNTIMQILQSWRHKAEP